MKTLTTVLFLSATLMTQMCFAKVENRLSEEQKIETFSKMVNSKCTLTDSQKVDVIHSEFKCITLINEKVDIRFSCKPEVVRSNLQKKADQICEKNTDDFTSNTPINKSNSNNTESKPQPLKIQDSASLQKSKIKNEIDLLPDPEFINPKIQIHAGGIKNNMPDILSEKLNLNDSNESSAWYLTQWKKTNYILPQKLVLAPANNNTNQIYTLYSKSLDSPSNESEVKTFKKNSGGHTFRLTGRNGWLHPAGGSNLFLSSPIEKDQSASFNKLMEYRTAPRILSLYAKPSADGADKDGTVVGQFFTGFTVQYNDPENKRKSVSMFIQMHHADTRGKTGTYRGCYPHNGYQEIVFSEPSEMFFSKAHAKTDVTENYKINVNKYLCNAIKTAYDCKSENGEKSVIDFSNYGNDLKNWKVTGFYTGLETQAGRGDNALKETRGEVEVSVEISTTRLVQNTATNFLSCNDVENYTPPDTEPDGTFKNAEGRIVEYVCGVVPQPIKGWNKVSDDCFHRSKK